MQSSANSGQRYQPQDKQYRMVLERHDEITQALFSASLIADVLPRLWERDPEEGRLRLSELRELTRIALVDISTLLNELQAPRTHTVKQKEELDDQRRTGSEKEDSGLIG